MKRLSAIPTIAATVLAATFGYSAFRKVESQEVTRESLSEFGVPARLVRPGVWALVSWEVTLALGVVAKQTRRLAGVSSLITLVTFTAAIGNHLAKGRNPRCGCFGGDSNARVGINSILRNTILSVCAILAAQISPPNPRVALNLLSRHWLSVIVILEGFILLRLLRQFGMIIRELSQNQPESAKKGDLVEFQQFEQSEELMATLSRLDEVSILFLSEGCSHCENLVSRMIASSVNQDDLIVVYVGSLASMIHELEQERLNHFYHDIDGRFSSGIGVGAFPTLIRIGADRKIIADPVLGGPAIGNALGLTLN